MQYILRTQNSRLERGLTNQSSTLRKLKYKNREGTGLKSQSWSVELPAPGFQARAISILLHCLSLPPV